MKNTSLILSTISLVAVVVFGVLFLTKDGKKAEVSAANGENTEAVAQKGDIVYVDLDKILMDYDMANDLRSVVETKVQNIQAEINRRGQKLQQQEIDFNNYAAQKQQEIQEEQLVMMNQLGDAIQTFITKYNEEKQYAMILTNSGGAPVITADAALDITEAVLAGLNEEYIKTKNQKSEE